MTRSEALREARRDALKHGSDMLQSAITVALTVHANDLAAEGRPTDEIERRVVRYAEQLIEWYGGAMQRIADKVLLLTADPPSDAKN
jgi:hypothetical protein